MAVWEIFLGFDGGNVGVGVGFMTICIGFWWVFIGMQS